MAVDIKARKRLDIYLGTVDAALELSDASSTLEGWKGTLSNGDLNHIVETLKHNNNITKIIILSMLYILLLSAELIISADQPLGNKGMQELLKLLQHNSKLSYLKIEGTESIFYLL